MTPDDKAASHRAHLERLCAEGGPLAADSRHATSQNPEWFNVKRGRARDVRQRVHDTIIGRFVETQDARRDRKAIVLAAPPGADKSTAQNALVRETRTQPEHWFAINADDFKDELLMDAMVT